MHRSADYTAHKPQGYEWAACGTYSVWFGVEYYTAEAYVDVPRNAMTLERLIVIITIVVVLC